MSEQRDRSSEANSAGHSPKLDLALVPEMSAAEALHVILSHLFDAMERNEQGIIDDSDSEFLHDFRVAVRRMRTALTQLRKAMDNGDNRQLQADFRRLSDITTPLRDLDVWLLTFNGRQMALPESMRDGLPPLRPLIEEQRNLALRTLLRELQSDAYARVKRHVRLALAHLEQDAAGGREMTARQLADRRIGKMYRRVVDAGEQISKASPLEALHELRKSCKKLRYLLEFFRSLYSKEETRHQIRQLKRLQDTLGAIQDARVQLQTLGEWREALCRQGASEATLAAVDRLAGDIRHTGKQARKGFGDSFARFAAEKNRKQMQQMLKQ